jgi:iron uptake system component EfeO
VRPLRLIALAALAALLLVPLACGDDDDAATTADAASTTAPATEAPTGTAVSPGDTTSTGEAAPPAPPANPAAARAVAAYRAYLRKRVNVMAAEAPGFAKALRQGTPARAQAIYPRLIRAYESIRPALEDLGYADRLGAAEGQAEGEWTGLHAIEKILFDTGTTVGTEELGATFVDDVESLQRELPGLELDPATIIGYSVALTDRVPAWTMTEPSEQYSRLHLYGVDGDLLGARAAYRSVRPMLDEQDVAQVDSSLGDAISVVDSLRAPIEFHRWDELTEGDIQAVIDAAAEARKDLGPVSQKL